MATYGVYLTTTDGRPFITSDTTPVNLLGKYTASGYGSASVNVTIDPTVINIPFVLSDSPSGSSAAYSGNVLTVKSDRTDSTGGNVSIQVYVFSIKTPVPPKWGIALWNAAGKCILTNETRVLRDIATIGTKGDDNASGSALNTTRQGKWAIQPDLAGVVSGVVNQRPFTIPVIFYAQFNGVNTTIGSVWAATPPTSGQGTLTSTRNSVRAINASLYD